MTSDNFCFYLQNRLIPTSQTGGQWYNDTSPFSRPWFCYVEGHYTECNNAMSFVVMMSVIMLSVLMQCHYTECHCVKCCYAECHTDRNYAWTNCSYQDEIWAEFSTLVVAVCRPCSYISLKPNCLT